MLGPFDEMYARAYACWKHSLPVATVHFWPRDRSSSQLERVYSCLWLTFRQREVASNPWEDLINISAECFKRLQFKKMTLFVVFFRFILARDTWPMIV